MKQIEFMMECAKVPKRLSFVQLPDAVVMIRLHKNIEVYHYSKKRDRMEIHFTNTDDKFKIPDKKILMELFRIHLTNEESYVLLHQYCKNNLTP